MDPEPVDSVPKPEPDAGDVMVLIWVQWRNPPMPPQLEGPAMLAIQSINKWCRSLDVDDTRSLWTVYNKQCYGIGGGHVRCFRDQLLG